MNIQEYISSGIAEAYAAGIATSEEVREMEQMMKLYPEVEAAVREAEEAMVKYARQHAVNPPPQLKQTIWQALVGETNIDEAQPTIKSTTHISIVPDVAARSPWMKYGLAASVALLIASAAGNVWMMNENNKVKSEVAAIAASQKVLLEEKNNALAAAEKANQEMQVLTLPKLVKINLAGVGSHADMAGMLYWDGATGDVYVDLNKMPEAPSGKQYQLWAIVDGKPVDAGMYDGNAQVAMHKMKTIPKAEMFAVTIENAGGSPSPTLDQMVVAGKTS